MPDLFPPLTMDYTIPKRIVLMSALFGAGLMYGTMIEKYYPTNPPIFGHIEQPTQYKTLDALL